uniref:Iso_dh domain-containing protein n=1 Tax=Parastrongyloides trichosuri TaxID=131310 RepID=A0A0N4ZN86_PARTI
MTITFDIVPGSGLKNENIEFILGTPINQILSSLQNVPRIVKKVQFIYSPKEPFLKDMSINLKEDGIRLIFDNKTQLLKLIEIYAPAKLVLSINNEIFSTPEQVADYHRVEKSFGPTHPGQYDDLQQLYLLNWHGISMAFLAKDSSAIQSTYAHGLATLHFSNTTTPLVDKMTIFYGSSILEEAKLPPQPSFTLCGTNKINEVNLITDNEKIVGLKINFSCETTNDGAIRRNENLIKSYEKIIRFNENENKVISELGSPSRIFYKSDDKMLIQKGVYKENVMDEEKTDYFFNYFSMGLVSYYLKI